MSNKQCRAYDEIYSKLRTNDAEKNIYKFAETMEMRRRDLNGVYYIKDDDQRVLIKEGEIKERFNEKPSSSLSLSLSCACMPCLSPFFVLQFLISFDITCGHYHNLLAMSFITYKYVPH